VDAIAEPRVTTPIASKKKKRKSEPSPPVDAFSKPSQKWPKNSQEGNTLRSCSKCNKQIGPGELRMPLCTSCLNSQYSTSKDSLPTFEISDLSSPLEKKRKIKSSATGRARTVAAELALVRDDHSLHLASTSVASLSDMCIRALGEHIDDVEALGCISDISYQKLARVLSKKRLLDMGKIPLFTGEHITSLALFDVTLIDTYQLGLLGNLCPNLRTLYLAFCGNAKDGTLSQWSESWKYLEELSIKGAYLINDHAWSTFLDKQGGSLTKLELDYASKFSEKAMESLLNSQKSNGYPLEELALEHGDSLNSHCMDLICSFNNLLRLSLMFSGQSLSIMIFDRLTQSLRQLRTLAFSHANQTLVDDNFLPMLRRLPCLQHLHLEEVHGLSKEGIYAWIYGQAAPPVVSKDEIEGNLTNTNEDENFKFSQDLLADVLDNVQRIPELSSFVISRCNGLNHDEVIRLIVTSLGRSLQKFGIRWCDQLSPVSILSIVDFLGSKGSGMGKTLEHLDVSWVRCLDDVLWQIVLTELKALKSITIFGCHKLSAEVINREWRNCNGEKVRIIGSEYNLV
jgi:DNA repair protein RAD7